jgi:hypothetical protein
MEFVTLNHVQGPAVVIIDKQIVALAEMVFRTKSA